MGLAAFVKGNLTTAVLHIKTPNSNPEISQRGLPPTRAAHKARLSWVLWKLSSAHWMGVMHEDALRAFPLNAVMCK